MDVRYEPEYERQYSADSPDDRLAYAGFLWAYYTYKPAQIAEEVQVGLWQWFLEDPEIKRALEPIPERMLLPPSQQTPSRTQGKQRKKTQGRTKGAGPLALQRLWEANESNGYEGLRNYRDHKDY